MWHFLDNDTKYINSVLYFLFLILISLLSVDFLQSIYGMLTAHGRGVETPRLIASVVAYNTACMVYWPTPSEVPLLLVPRLSLWVVVACASIGKVIGAVVVYHSRWAINKGSRSLVVLLSWRWVLDVGSRIEKVVDSQGFWVYLMMQAIPLLPMRSSLYFYCCASKNISLVLVGAVLGGVTRYLLVAVVWAVVGKFLL